VAFAAKPEETYVAFRAMFDEFRHLGQNVSPSLLLPGLVAQTHAIQRLTATATGPSRARLLLLAAAYADYCGWMSQEAGAITAALTWTDTATRIAAEAGDRDVASHALIRHALLSLYRRDAAETIALARQAQSLSGTGTRIRAQAAQREAQGHALAGRATACQDAVDTAAALLSASPDVLDGRPTLGPTTLPDTIGLVTGWCLYDLGRPGEAADLLSRELARFPTSTGRATARFATRLSLAYAASGDVERSCRTAGAVLATLAAVDSATIRTDVRRLASTLNRWPRHPLVRELAPGMAAVLHGR
jgi:hypothetical protein